MSSNINLKDKVILITGGTGSFGGTVSNYLLENDIGEIRIFSRDENKQDLMRKKIKDSRVNFFIGPPVRFLPWCSHQVMRPQVRLQDNVASFPHPHSQECRKHAP